MFKREKTEKLNKGKKWKRQKNKEGEKTTEDFKGEMSKKITQL